MAFIPPFEAIFSTLLAHHYDPSIAKASGMTGDEEQAVVNHCYQKAMELEARAIAAAHDLGAPPRMVLDALALAAARMGLALAAAPQTQHVQAWGPGGEPVPGAPTNPSAPGLPPIPTAPPPPTTLINGGAVSPGAPPVPSLVQQGPPVPVAGPPKL